MMTGSRSGVIDRQHRADRYSRAPCSEDRPDHVSPTVDPGSRAVLLGQANLRSMDARSSISRYNWRGQREPGLPPRIGLGRLSLIGRIPTNDLQIWAF